MYFRMFKPGPRVRLWRPAGAAAPSGGSELHEVSERGGHFMPRR